MSPYSCSHCTKLFTTPRALQGHTRMHGPSGGVTTQLMCSCIITKQEMAVKYLEQHIKSLKTCPECNQLFKPDGAQVYCSRSCATTVTNKTRGPVNGPIDKQLHCSGCGDLVTVSGHSSVAICQYCRDPVRPRLRAPIFTQFQVGGASKLNECTCSVCDARFLAKRNSTKICQVCSSTMTTKYSRTKVARDVRYKYAFKFDCSQYPDLFDQQLIATVGWYAPARKIDRNLNGLTKDHKISVVDAERNDYDPFYITHPLNCDIIRQSENSSKKTRSTIAYEELVKQVDMFENKLCSPG